MSDGEGIHSLYRRYRPQRFEEVLGQDHVTRALRNAVASGRVSHAYLFSGPRGTGKTSTARILAKALNCANPEGGEPCCVCESCRLVAEGRSYDVEELDAASNSGVDAIRALISTVSTASYGTWKIYIVDEVHMLSQAASNALLKTLEEPPEHVVFVLATTSAQKVLATIRSRTQHFEFRLLDEGSIDRLIEDVTRRAGLDVDPESADWVRRRGGGSARDTLSFLDQVVALGEVPDGAIQEVLDLAAALIAHDPPGVIEGVEALISTGVDAAQILDDLIGVVREAFLEKLGVRAHGGRERVSSPLQQLLDTRSIPNSLGDFTRIMEAVGRSSLDLREGLDPIALVEALLIAVAQEGSRQGPTTHGAPVGSPNPNVPLTLLEDRLRLLEDELSELRKVVFSLTGQAVVQPERATPQDTPSTSVDEVKPPQSRPDHLATPSSAEPQGTHSQTTPRASTPRGGDPLAGVRRGMKETSPGAAQRESAAPPAPPQSEPEVRASADASVAQERPVSEAPAASSPPESDPVLAAGGGHATDTVAATLTVERVAADWSSEISKGISKKAWARFQASRVVGVVGSRIELAFPNEFHLKRASELLDEVQLSFTSFYRDPSLQVGLVVSEEGSGGVPSEQPISHDDLLSEFESPEATSVVDHVVDSISRVFPGAREVR